MRYVLSSGKTVQVDFHHEYHKVPVKKNMAKRKNEMVTEVKPYLTICEVMVDGKSVIGEAKCHHNDNFCKRTGRKISYNNMVKNSSSFHLQSLLSKEERQELFYKVFPEYDPIYNENDNYEEIYVNTKINEQVHNLRKESIKRIREIVSKVCKGLGY